jgi:hypothetical protein
MMTISPFFSEGTKGLADETKKGLARCSSFVGHKCPHAVECNGSHYSKIFVFAFRSSAEGTEVAQGSRA